jgi:hypothetical protein
MRWAGHVARTVNRRAAYMFLAEKPGGKNHLEDPGVDGSIIINLTLEKCNGVWVALIWLM